MKYKYKISNRKSLRGGSNDAMKTGGNNAMKTDGNNAMKGANNTSPIGTSFNTPNKLPAGSNNTSLQPLEVGNNPSASLPVKNNTSLSSDINSPIAKNNSISVGANNAGNNTRSFKNTMSNAFVSGIGKAANLSNKFVGKAGNVLSKSRNTAKATVGRVYETKITYYNDIISKFIIMIILLAIFYGILSFMRYIIVYLYESRIKSTTLYDANKNAKHHANPISNDKILRSENENGIEFTYSFWICILSLEYKQGDWKHIMHKGSTTSYPNRAPGVWLHPSKNSLRVYMNTFDNVLEYTDIDDIPLKQWVCIQLVLQNMNSLNEPDQDILDLGNNHALHIYVNGQNKKSKMFQSVPKQNNGDIYINNYGGYDGYFSKLKYYPYAVDYEQIGALIREGPSNIPTGTGQIPPYLNDKWWFEYNIDSEYSV